jgi:hypothetical protein
MNREEWQEAKRQRAMLQPRSGLGSAADVPVSASVIPVERRLLVDGRHGPPVVGICRGADPALIAEWTAGLSDPRPQGQPARALSTSAPVGTGGQRQAVAA